MTRDKKITVIGAGVSGITTAIACQIAGYNVTIYTKQHPFENPPTLDFSSHYPAASILPHSVNHPEISSLFEQSSLIFEVLYESQFTGLEKHQHFELFSTPQNVPHYAENYSTFELLGAGNSNFQPKHPTLNSSFGWFFECLFADWMIYYRALFELFIKLGGGVIQQKLRADSLSRIDTDIIINCAEIYGASLLGEDFEPNIYRGHLLHIPRMPKLRTTTGQKLSYNFMPDIDIYSTENGVEQDVYFYQRDDRWILGGSRQKGTIDSSGKWIGEQVIEPYLEINGQRIPEQVLILNQEILNHTFGEQDINFNEVRPKIGYRFMGNANDQLRLDESEIDNKLILNNFGHGGSGVTLSWGCALRLLDLISQRTGTDHIDSSDFKKRLLKSIKLRS